MLGEETWGNTVVVLWPLVNGAADLVLALASQISVWFNWPWAPVKGSLTWTLVSCLMAWGLAAKLSGQLRFLTFWLFLVRIWSCNEVQPLLSWKFPVSAPFRLHLLHWLLTGHSLHETTVKIRIWGDSLRMRKKPVRNKQTWNRAIRDNGSSYTMSLSLLCSPCFLPKEMLTDQCKET